MRQVLIQQTSFVLRIYEVLIHSSFLDLNQLKNYRCLKYFHRKYR